jgi:hypothetical protein
MVVARLQLKRGVRLLKGRKEEAVARLILAVAVAGLCLGCRSEDVNLRVKVIVPAEIPSVSSGVLRMSLWAYDPQIADAPASLVDADSLFFAHTAGERYEGWMTVQGNVPAGTRHYITVRGFELLQNGEKYILWDGIEGTAAPTIVVMRPVQ